MLEQPKYMDYWILDEKTDGWKIREDAPKEAKEEFDAYMNDIHSDLIDY